MQTFVVKLASGIAGFISSMVLFVFHISSNKEAVVTEPIAASSRMGLRLSMTIIPIVVLVIGFIVFKKRYILTDRKLAEISKELEKNIRIKRGEIMIQTANDIFVLHTAHTTYAFRKLPTGQLEHLYYGRKIHVCEPLDENAVAPLIEKHTFQPGNSCVYDREHDAYTLEDLCLEMSSYGKGDIREPFVELIYEDGSFSSDFVYESSARFEGREARDAEDALPASYDEKIRWNISV